MSTKSSTYKDLLALGAFPSTDPEGALRQLAFLVDSAWDRRDPRGLRHAIELSEALAIAPLPAPARPILDYYVSNAWGCLSELRKLDGQSAWDWEQPEIGKSILHLRRALAAEALDQLDATTRCAIITNLANTMHRVGRFVEAIALWDRVLGIDSTFAMAQGNLGCNLNTYARCLYDRGHKAQFIIHAHHHLGSALRGQLDPDARAGFSREVAWIRTVMREEFLKPPGPEEVVSLGTTEAEVEYRRWCLQHRLFLNPMNDLGPYSTCARDVLTTPSIVVGIEEGPGYPGFFNQMKQEYVSARYSFYEAKASDEPHFSDRDVLLLNTLDYPAYCLAAERAKWAFRAAYSLLDKCAFFLNRYLGLGIPDHKVDFKSIWYQSRDREQGPRKEFVARPNAPLRGLFWLSMDLYEDQDGFRDANEPDARDLASIRNHLEHKYLKLHDSFWIGPPDPKNRTSMAMSDSFAHSIRRGDFYGKCLRLLQMARAALTYLSLSIHIEELARVRAKPGARCVMPMPLDLVEDDWKR